MKAALERRLQMLESRTDNCSRMVHFIMATDLADSDRQIAGLLASGKVGPATASFRSPAGVPRNS